MLDYPTTFVIGAGSSCELGLPSGAALKERITSLLKPSDNNMYGFNDSRVYRALQEWQSRSGFQSTYGNQNYDLWKSAGRAIRQGLPLARSIDNFLHSHRDNEYIVQLGKVSILITILSSERGSLLYDENPRNTGICTNYTRPLYNQGFSDKFWMFNLAELLFSQSDLDSLPERLSKVNFVVFNYDRCLEQFLWLSLRGYFDIDENRAAELVGLIKIVHPYGSVAPLPWQSDSGVPLGHVDRHDYFDLLSNIKTFTESVDSEVSVKVKSAVHQAHTLVFMGFGFLNQNVEMLSCGNGANTHRILTTAYGFSNSDQQVLYDAVSRIVQRPVGGWDDRSRSGIPVFIEPETCKRLMINNQLRLSFE